VKYLKKGVVFPWNAHICVFIYWYFCVICELHIQVNLDHITQLMENLPLTLCSWLDKFRRKFAVCIIRVSSMLKFLWSISTYLAVYTPHPTNGCFHQDIFFMDEKFNSLRLWERFWNADRLMDGGVRGEPQWMMIENRDMEEVSTD